MLELVIGLLLPWIVKIVSAILVFIIGKWLAKKISIFLARVLERAKVDETLVKFLETTAYIVLLVLVIIAALGTLGINTTSFAAIIGAFGLAVGFAL